MGKAIAAKRCRRRISARSARYEDVAAAFQRDAAAAPHDWRPYALRIRPTIEMPDLAPGIDLARLRLFFRRRPVAAIDVADGRAYALQREQAGAPPGTINEELKTLARMLTFAVRAGMLQQCPAFEFLRDPAREELWLRERELMMRPPVATRGEPVSRGGPMVMSAPAAKRKRSEDWWDESLRRHPLDETDHEGNLRGAPWRTGRILIEQEIRVDRSTVSRRLGKAREEAADLASRMK